AASPSTSDPTPLGALWTSSWTSASLTPYTRHCHSTATFRASIYKLSELYPTLETFAPELKVFYNKQLYPGSWSGHDAHGNGRELLKMRYADLPFAVREWLRKTKTQRHFSVQEDYVFFAPGAVYPRLPLFVDEAEGPECMLTDATVGLFEDLDNYSNELEDGKVVGQLTHEMKGENEVEVTIEVFQVKK
ncbi:hypothetical protein BDV95DRAFT_452986, partial [Massariosphaeria phaeospora]